LPCALFLVAGCFGAEAEERAPVRRAAEFRSDAVQRALDDVGRAVRTRGFAADGEEWRGFVVEQSTEVGEVSLRGGSCYVVIGAGSAALHDLVLRVHDGDGGDVARDVVPGAAAAARFCPPRTGTYYVSVRAGAGSGIFAVRRFRGPAGLPVQLDDLFPPPPAPPAVPSDG
jgi:hypothetical protein